MPISWQRHVNNKQETENVLNKFGAEVWIAADMFLLLLFFCCLQLNVYGGTETETKETKYPNGQTKERYTVVKDKDKSYLWDCQYSCWYVNGQIKVTGTLSSNAGASPQSGRTGKWTFWYKNGQKKAESLYKDGKLDGPSTSWYENGQKKAESFYKDGKMVKDEPATVATTESTAAAPAPALAPTPEKEPSRSYQEPSGEYKTCMKWCRDCIGYNNGDHCGSVQKCAEECARFK